MTSTPASSVSLPPDAVETAGTGNHLHTVAGGAAIAFSGSIVRTALSYLFNILVARSIGAEAFGLFSIGLSIANVGDRVALLGFDNTLLRYIAIYEGEQTWDRLRDTLRLATRFVALGGLLVGSILFFSADWLASRAFHQPELGFVLRIFALALPFSALTTLWIFSIQSFKAMHYVAIVRDLLRPGFQIVLAGGLLVVGWGLRGVLVAYAVPTLLAAACALFLLGRLVRGRRIMRPEPDVPPRPAGVDRPALIAFAVPMYLLSLTSAVTARTGTVLLGALSVPGQAGVYFAAFRTVSLGLLALEGFNAIFSPIIADLHNRGERDQLAGLYRVVTKWQLTLTLPLFMGMAILAPRIMALFGHEFRAGGTALAILCVAFGVHSAAGSVSPLLEMTGRPTLNLINVLLSFALNVALTVTLIPRFGIVGAALATGAAMIFLVILRFAEVFWLIGFQPYTAAYGKPLLAAGLASLTLAAVTGFWPGPTGLLIGPPLMIVTYAGLLLILGLTAEDRRVLRLARDRLARSRTARN